MWLHVEENDIFLLFSEPVQLREKMKHVEEQLRCSAFVQLLFEQMLAEEG